MACVHVGLLDECYVQDHVIADELVRSCRLEGLIRKLQREDSRKTQRGFTNMIVVAGGEGPSEKYISVISATSSSFGIGLIKQLQVFRVNGLKCSSSLATVFKVTLLLIR